MNYLTDIKPLEDQGLTDQQIVDTLKATGVTRKKIDRATLMDLLNKRTMMRKVTQEGQASVWYGSALAMKTVIAGSGNDAFINAFDEWFSHITNPTNNYWDTTEATWSAPFWGMYQTFADQPTMPTTEDFQAIAALGGGFKYESLTPEEVVAKRREHEMTEALKSVRSRCNEAIGAASLVLEDDNAVPSDVMTAAEAAWSA